MNESANMISAVSQAVRAHLLSIESGRGIVKKLLIDAKLLTIPEKKKEEPAGGTNPA